jgi:hypothetical protein
MTRLRFTIFILGLTAAVVPAHASLTYYCSNGCNGTTSQFTTQATITDDLTLTSLIAFTGALSQFGSVANDEYIDSTTGVEFVSFNSTGGTNVGFASVSAGDLDVKPGDSVEVILPGLTYGIGVKFTTSTVNGETLCIDPTTSQFNSCDSGGTSVADGAPGFVGTLDDNPTLAPLTTIWLNQTTSAATDLQSFEIAEQPAEQSSGAPDPATMLTLGAGLIFIALLRRRPRLFRFLHR